LSPFLYALWLALGLVAAAGFIGVALRSSPQFEQKVYGVGLLVAALIYVGFALVWGDAQWLVIELAGVAICGILLVAAVRAGFVLVALGWLLHPAWDLGLHLYGPGEHIVPQWYAVACVAFDLTVAGAIAYRLSVWTGQGARGSILGA
jgi:hypothetical protein